MTAQGLGAEDSKWPDFAPRIEMDEDDLDEEFNYSHVVHILTSQVRNHYLKYVQNLLDANFRCCSTEASKVSDNVIQKCAIKLEEKAARSCMVVNLYRKSILQIIQNIRNETSRSQLNECIGMEIQREVNIRMVDASVQTVSYDRNSHAKASEQRLHNPVRPKTLDEKLRYFEFKMNNERKIAQRARAPPSVPAKPIISKPKPIMNRPKPVTCITPSTIANTPESLPPPATPPAFHPSHFPPKVTDQDIEDDITRELHEIFGTQQSQFMDPIEEIFGESIISLKPEHSQPLPTPIVHPVNPPDAPCLPASHISEPVDFTNELTNSIWPCELHRQRLKLHRVLESISEKGWRHNEKVKQRFLQLFGEDDDDDFGPYSPSLAVNDILMASCKKRIAPWIVKSLMVPMQNGQIGNRYLFKKIAKRIAEGILVVTQLPDEKAIRDAVMHFFTMYPKVNTLADMDDT